MRAFFRYAAGFLISAVFLFLALRHIEWAGVLDAWKSAHPGQLILGWILLVSSWAVAAARWRVLLSPAPGLKVCDAFAYLNIGYLVNTVLPLRMGDMARAVLMGRNRGLGISRTLGSMVLERALDVLTLLCLMSFLSTRISIPPVLRRSLAGLAGLAAVLVIALLVLAFNRDRLHHFTVLMARVMPHRLAERFVLLMTNFTGGIQALRQPVWLAWSLLMTIGSWAVMGLAALVWIRAFNLATPWYAGYFVLVVVNLGVAIPSSPGYIGVYHYLAVISLSLWVPDRAPCLAYAVGTHALNMLTNLGLGGYFVAREGVSLKRLAAAPNM